MKTTEILITQFKHINSNFKEYLKMAIPIIFGLFFISTIEQISTYLFNDIYSSSLSITINIIQILIIIYVCYYFFRNYINLHRFIILQDTSNYYSPLKKFKVTFKYILYFLLYILSAMLVLFLCIIMNYAFPNLIIFQFGVGWMLLFVCAFVYPFFGLALPQIAIGEKISLKKIFYESKGSKETLFYQMLILYMPLYFFNKIVTQITMNQNILLNFISALITVYATAMFVGCLSRTYLLSKELRN